MAGSVSTPFSAAVTIAFAGGCRASRAATPAIAEKLPSDRPSPHRRAWRATVTMRRAAVLEATSTPQTAMPSASTRRAWCWWPPLPARAHPHSNVEEELRRVSAELQQLRDGVHLSMSPAQPFSDDNQRAAPNIIFIHPSIASAGTHAGLAAQLAAIDAACARAIEIRGTCVLVWRALTLADAQQPILVRRRHVPATHTCSSPKSKALSRCCRTTSSATAPCARPNYEQPSSRGAGVRGAGPADARRRA